MRNMTELPEAETMYRIYVKLSSGQWWPWSTLMRDLGYAREQMEANQEVSPGEYRLAEITMTPEWIA